MRHALLLALTLGSLGAAAPKPRCDAAAVRGVEGRVEVHLKQRDFEHADMLLSDLVARCRGELPAEKLAALHAEWAVVALRRGDPKLCLDLIAEAPEVPADSRAARTLAYDQVLCGGDCPEDRPPCVRARNLLLKEAKQTRGFRPVPCAISGHSDAVALSPVLSREQKFSCLQLIPPAASPSDAGTPSPACPTLRLIQQRQNGEISQAEVKLPADSQLDDPAHCCNFRTLTSRPGKATPWIRVFGEGPACQGTGAAQVDERFRWLRDGLRLELATHAPTSGK